MRAVILTSLLGGVEGKWSVYAEEEQTPSTPAPTSTKPGDSSEADKDCTGDIAGQASRGIDAAWIDQRCITFFTDVSNGVDVYTPSAQKVNTPLDAAAFSDARDAAGLMYVLQTNPNSTDTSGNQLLTSGNRIYMASGANMRSRSMCQTARIQLGVPNSNWQIFERDAWYTNFTKQCLVKGQTNADGSQMINQKCVATLQAQSIWQQMKSYNTSLFDTMFVCAAPAIAQQFYQGYWAMPEQYTAIQGADYFQMCFPYRMYHCQTLAESQQYAKKGSSIAGTATKNQLYQPTLSFYGSSYNIFWPHKARMYVQNFSAQQQTINGGTNETSANLPPVASEKVIVNNGNPWVGQPKVKGDAKKAGLNLNTAGCYKSNEEEGFAAPFTKCAATFCCRMNTKGLTNPTISSCPDTSPYPANIPSNCTLAPTTSQNSPTFSRIMRVTSDLFGLGSKTDESELLDLDGEFEFEGNLENDFTDQFESLWQMDSNVDTEQEQEIPADVANSTAAQAPTSSSTAKPAKQAVYCANPKCNSGSGSATTMNAKCMAAYAMETGTRTMCVVRAGTPSVSGTSTDPAPTSASLTTQGQTSVQLAGDCMQGLVDLNYLQCNPDKMKIVSSDALFAQQSAQLLQQSLQTDYTKLTKGNSKTAKPQHQICYDDDLNVATAAPGQPSVIAKNMYDELFYNTSRFDCVTLVVQGQAPATFLKNFFSTGNLSVSPGGYYCLQFKTSELWQGGLTTNVDDEADNATSLSVKQWKPLSFTGASGANPVVLAYNSQAGPLKTKNVNFNQTLWEKSQGCQFCDLIGYTDCTIEKADAGECTACKYVIGTFFSCNIK